MISDNKKKILQKWIASLVLPGGGELQILASS